MGLALLPCALTGCPLTDNYFVDSSGGVAGVGGVGGVGPAGGAGGTVSGAGGGGALGGAMTGGSSGVGGSAAAMGGTGGGAPTTGGTAGSGGIGGGKGGRGGAAGTATEAGEGGMAGDGGNCVPEVCDGVSNDCDDEIDEGGVCPKDCAAREYDGHVYVLCLSKTLMAGSTYNTAYNRCAGLAEELELARSFDLASLEDDDENTFLKDWIAEASTLADGAVWMGANDREVENTWVWGRGASAVQFFRGYVGGGGEPLMDRYDDFAPGKPASLGLAQEDCGAFDGEVDWQWNDRDCAKRQMGFVCEQLP